VLAQGEGPVRGGEGEHRTGHKRSSDHPDDCGEVELAPGRDAVDDHAEQGRREQPTDGGRRMDQHNREEPSSELSHQRAGAAPDGPGVGDRQRDQGLRHRRSPPG